MANSLYFLVFDESAYISALTENGGKSALTFHLDGIFFHKSSIFLFVQY